MKTEALEKGRALRASAPDCLLDLSSRFKIGHKDFTVRHGGPVSVTLIGSLTHSAPIISVRLSELTTTQETVNLEDLEAYLVNPDAKRQRGIKSSRTGALLDLPIVVGYEGQKFIHDGHHRLTARLMSGHDSAQVRFVDLDSLGLVTWANAR